MSETFNSQDGNTVVPSLGKPAYTYPTYAPGRNFGAISQKEANAAAVSALVLGILSFFTLGLLLSIPGYFLAKQAELVNGKNAKTAKIVNLVSMGVSVIAIFVALAFVLGNSGVHEGL